MSPIIGTYTAVNAKLVISTADDNTGAITGTFTLGSLSVKISGGWNTSTMSPSAVFQFAGGTFNPPSPSVVVAGVGATTNFQTFADTNISISIASKGGVISQVSGHFVRS